MNSIRFYLASLLMVCGCQQRFGSGEPAKLYALAREVSGEIFETANIANDTIAYYDDSRKVLKKSSLPADILSQMDGQEVLYIERNPAGILFVLGGAADDVWGLLYSPSGTIHMEGIVRIERAEKDWYFFSTL